jgi:hypothetical protein
MKIAVKGNLEKGGGGYYGYESNNSCQCSKMRNVSWVHKNEAYNTSHRKIKTLFLKYIIRTSEV